MKLARLATQTAILLAAGQLVGAATVYDNTTTEGGTAVFPALGTDYGNIVTLAGAERSVTEVTVLINKQSASNIGTIDIRLRLWSVSGAFPDTMLFESAVMDNLNITNRPIVFPVTFDVPSVLVDDRFAFSTAILERNSTIAVGYREFGPPTVGTWRTTVFRARDATVWRQAAVQVSLGARVIAVPEPLSIGGLFAGAVLAFRRRG